MRVADASFSDMRLGLFVHYLHPVCEHPGGGTTWSDGKAPAGLDELADNLDVADLVGVAQSMRAQYLQFTTWHATMAALYPSKVLTRRLPGHCSKRDVIRDLIDALRPTGIRLILYIHPSDGHDFSKEDQQRAGWTDGPPFARWNDLVSETVAEVVDRYGKDVAGYWIDGGLPEQVDQPRLRRTILSRQPKAWLIQNSGLSRACVDYGAHEEFSDPYPATTWQMNAVITHDWIPRQGFVRICPEFAFQYTVFLAGTKGNAGGVAWACGPYVGGRWEPGVREFAQQFGTCLDRVRPAVFGTRPSAAYVTAEKTPFKAVRFVATESPDGKITYVHVLQPPQTRQRQGERSGEPIFDLPAPANGRRFTSARRLGNGHAVRLSVDAQGVHLRLGSSDAWDALDTVIVLE